MAFIFPTAPCFVTGDPCSRGMDCSRCDVPKPPVQWVCIECIIGRWDVAREPRLKRDKIFPGLYSSGICSRCGAQRICLLAVLPPGAPS